MLKQPKEIKENVYFFFKSLIDQPNKNAISSINIKVVKTRLMREYTELNTKFPNSIIHVYNNEELKNVSFSIRIEEGSKLQGYVFIIENNYPFHPPCILYNNKPYSNLLNLQSNRFGDYSQKLYKKKCLCCTSLICKNNWSPAINLGMIIEDINKNRKYKRNIIYAILIDQIKGKYLIDDIDILTYII